VTQPILYSQPEPEHIARAGLTMAGVLAGELDFETRFAVAGALAILRDVHPPYPPHPAEVDAVPAEAGVAGALASLARAVEHSGSIREVLRIGHAARELHLVTPPAIASGQAAPR
jgi:hypothetical protein